MSCSVQVSSRESELCIVSPELIQLDTDGGSMTKVAEDMSDFFLNYLFGERANEYSGDDWLQELIDAKIIPE